MKNISQAESEAILRLVLAGRCRDGKVSLAEGEVFEQQMAKLPWQGEHDRHFFAVTEAARIRKTLATEGDAFVAAQCAALQSAEARETALTMLELVLAADGMEARESAFVASVQKALHGGATTLHGGCYCKAITYEIRGKLLFFANCHCPDCRKFTGSAFSSVLVTEADGFKLVSGSDQLRRFESSPGKERCFCGTCGCHLFSKAAHRPGMIFVRAGSLDDDPPLRPQHHFWVSAKAPWHDICDTIPQHPAGLPPK